MSDRLRQGNEGFATLATLKASMALVKYRRDRRGKLEIREYAGEPRFSPMYHTRSIIS
jgi:hypothetical protein